MIRKTLFLIISAAAITGCASSKMGRTTVARDHGFNVALEKVQERGRVVPRGYEHPFKMEISNLKKIMESLEYVEERGLLRKTDKPSPVFQAVEIDRLAPVLVNTLARADADQRVRFTSYNQEQLPVFSLARKTEGVIFIRPAGRVNIAFNYINTKRQSGEANAIDPIYSDTDPLKIKGSDTRITAFSPSGELYEFANGEQAPMWVVANLEKPKNSLAPSMAAPTPARETPSPVVAPKADVEKTPIEKTMSGQEATDAPHEDIRNNLEFLKELLEEGLISEDDYRIKTEELLNRIN